MARLHAILSPSSAERWLACPPSAQINARLEDTGSVFAAEGTLAHKIAELQLSLALKQITKRIYNTKVKKLQEDELFYQGMMDEVQEYTDFVMSEYQSALSEDPAAEIYIEQRLDLSTYAPESFGTGDAVILTKDYVHVIDLKFGKGVVVDAEENPQLKLYGLGALEEFGFLHDIKEVLVTIAQVRLGSISTYRAPASEVLRWGKAYVRPRAELAMKGEGEFFPGDHCRFCKFGPQCKPRAEYYEDEYERYQGVTLTNEDLSRLLGLIKSITDWAKDIEENALFAALVGDEIPGWKLVEGRSVRKITDDEGLASMLFDEGFTSDDVYKPQELKNLGDLEKLVGKKRFSEISEPYIEKPPGKPTLVPNSDKRPAIDLITRGLDFDN